MKRVLTAIAVVLAAIFAVTGCNDYGNTFQANTGAQITTLSPSNIAAGSPSFTLTINGSGFVSQTYITWNGGKLATTDIDDSSGDVLQVYATIPASLVANAGTAEILTHNPYSGAGNNGLSNPLNFIVNAAAQPFPVPLLQSISPTSVTAGSAAFTLTLTGADFVTNSTPAQAATVFWNAGTTSTMLTILSASSTQITVTVPATLVGAAGTTNVTVVNPPNPAGTPPAGGGGSSGPLAFTINATPAAAVVKAQAAALETPALSADGRYVAYTAGDGTHTQIYLRDTCQGAPPRCVAQTSLVSVGADGLGANDDSHTPSMSADGRYVAFASAATDFLTAVTPSASTGRQIYLRDTCTGAASACSPATQLVSMDTDGQLLGLESILPSVSASGRFVAFVAVAKSGGSSPSSLSRTVGPPVSTTNSGYQQIFVRDTCLGAANCTAKTSRISLQPGDESSSSPVAGAASAGPAVSGDAKKIALNGGGTAVLFTQSVAVDDRVFVAVLQAPR
jgi:hypothetical protein